MVPIFMSKFELFNGANLQLSGEAMHDLLTCADSHFIFVKNIHSIYQYNNKQFASLMGLKSAISLTGYQDKDLTRDKSKLNLYLQHHEHVLDTCTSLQTQADVVPKHNPLLAKLVSGMMHPVFDNYTKPVAVLGIMQLHNQLFQLDIDTAVSLTGEELGEVLSRHSYPIKLGDRTISLSKREVQCLVALFKGCQAGEIAAQLKLKQSTVEFYLENLKNKLGESKKSALIQAAIHHQVIQQLVL
jgi:DNA-binding CsgD family transcriptional regulator